MSFSVFTDEERELLARHELAVYRDKIILGAQPPVSELELSRIEKLAGAAIPDRLVELWRVAYGGELDYDLTAAMGDHVYSVSFTELFYPNSGRYRDLDGWIEHEQALAHAAAEAQGLPAPERLRYLPFGGFEYLERVYVVTEGPEAGEVVIWAQGLPPAWKGQLSEDAVARLAPNVGAAFDRLTLLEDPRYADPKSFPSGLATLEAIDRLRGESANLAARLEALLVASVANWRAIVLAQAFDGSESHAEAGRMAWVYACDHADTELAGVLLEHRYPVDRHVTGVATPLVYALSKGASFVAHRLLDSGRALGHAPVIFIEALDHDLAGKLLAAGVEFDVAAVLSVARTGDADLALRLITDGRRSGDWGDVRATLLERAAQERLSAKKIEAGTMGSYATPDQHRKMAAGLEAVAARLESAGPPPP